jgi:putative phosphoesterase
MKLAVIADIHGNIAALDAVLADIATRDVDQIVNLGDIVSGPLFPSEVADRLMPLDIVTIRGNHERYVLTLPDEKLGATDTFTRARLRPDQIAWLQSLPQTHWLTDDILLVHGTENSDVEYFLETVDEAGLRQATPEEIATRAGKTQARLILCAHTHLQRMARVEGGSLIVNPGSVGLPAYDDHAPFPHASESGTPHARYALIDIDADDIKVEFVLLDYDWESAAVVADSNGKPNWGRALRTGRMS